MIPEEHISTIEQLEQQLLKRYVANPTISLIKGDAGYLVQCEGFADLTLPFGLLYLLIVKYNIDDNADYYDQLPEIIERIYRQNLIKKLGGVE